MKHPILYSMMLLGGIAFAQVGINTAAPEATLDIQASMPSAPSNTDGLLVPRIDDFPATNPQPQQNSMIVYLTTTRGSNAPGFYFWNATLVTPAWQSLSPPQDNDWNEVGTTDAPDALSDNIFTNGNVGIGETNPSGDLHISNTRDAVLILEADTDNANEADNPSLRLLQDGGALSTNLEMEGSSGTAFPGSNANDFIMYTNNIGVEMQFAPNRDLALTLRSSGQVRLSDYTSTTTHTGTATTMLALDADGDIIQEPLTENITWGLTGNSNINEATNFIGTTTNTDVIFRRLNQTKMRLDDNWVAFRDEIRVKKSGTLGSDTNLVRLDDSFGGNNGTVTVFNDGDAQHYIRGGGTTLFNNENLDLDFQIQSTTEDDAFLLDATDGSITLGNYGAGTITGTATRLLGIDANGRIIEQALPGPSTPPGPAANGSGNLGNATMTSANIQDFMKLEPSVAPSNPQAGQVYFDATTKKLRCYDGTTWNDLF